MGILALHFFPQGSRVNPIVIGPLSYKKGTAKLVPDSKKLVNKLWVKGGKQISELYTQDITVGTIPIPLDYPPRTPITVTIGGVVKTLGIQHLTEEGTTDFLINANEKLLIPDLVTTGTGTISYKYEYPIKILLEEPISQEQYGVFEDILNVKTNDKILALELGYKHLFKYSQPVISGTISPIEGQYRAGEVIKVDLPILKIDQYLKIQEASYTSISSTEINIGLTLETPERDMSNILKDLKQRLDKLEKETYKNDEGPVEKYIAKEEYYYWRETAIKTEPIQSENWLFWNEILEATARPVLLPAEDLYPGETLYP